MIWINPYRREIRAACKEQGIRRKQYKKRLRASRVIPGVIKHQAWLAMQRSQKAMDDMKSAAGNMIGDADKASDAMKKQGMAMADFENAPGYSGPDEIKLFDGPMTLAFKYAMAGVVAAILFLIALNWGH